MHRKLSAMEALPAEQLSELQAEVVRLKAKVAQLEVSNRGLLGQLEQKLPEREQEPQSQVAELERENARLRSVNAELDKENAGLRSLNAELTKELETKETDLAEQLLQATVRPEMSEFEAGVGSMINNLVPAFQCPDLEAEPLVNGVVKAIVASTEEQMADMRTELECYRAEIAKQAREIKRQQILTSRPQISIPALWQAIIGYRCQDSNLTQLIDDGVLYSINWGALRVYLALGGPRFLNEVLLQSLPKYLNSTNPLSPLEGYLDWEGGDIEEQLFDQLPDIVCIPGKLPDVEALQTTFLSANPPFRDEWDPKHARMIADTRYGQLLRQTYFLAISGAIERMKKRPNYMRDGWKLSKAEFEESLISVHLRFDEAQYRNLEANLYLEVEFTIHSAAVGDYAAQRNDPDPDPRRPISGGHWCTVKGNYLVWPLVQGNHLEWLNSGNLPRLAEMLFGLYLLDLAREFQQTMPAYSESVPYYAFSCFPGANVGNPQYNWTLLPTVAAYPNSEQHIWSKYGGANVGRQYWDKVCRGLESFAYAENCCSLDAQAPIGFSVRDGAALDPDHPNFLNLSLDAEYRYAHNYPWLILALERETPLFVVEKKEKAFPNNRVGERPRCYRTVVKQIGSPSVLHLTQGAEAGQSQANLTDPNQFRQTIFARIAEQIFRDDKLKMTVKGGYEQYGPWIGC